MANALTSATTKDAAAGDMPREGGKQPVIRGFPNGVTRQRLCAVIQY